MSTLQTGMAIVLFRFYKDFDVVNERLRILRYFDPDLPIFGLYGGPIDEFGIAKKSLENNFENLWCFPENREPSWKWFHTDIMQKEWFRDFGYQVNFDFLISYEYDLLTLSPLRQLLPNINDTTIAVSALENLDEIKNTWNWTSRSPHKEKFEKFSEYMKTTFGTEIQKTVCLGPGPVLPKKFMAAFSNTEDIDLVHEEISYPAYAEALGFNSMNNNLHPGFHAPPEEESLFSCEKNATVTLESINNELKKPKGRRAFHPVKYLVTLEDLGIPKSSSQ